MSFSSDALKFQAVISYILESNKRNYMIPASIFEEMVRIYLNEIESKNFINMNRHNYFFPIFDLYDEKSNTIVSVKARLKSKKLIDEFLSVENDKIFELLRYYGYTTVDPPLRIIMFLDGKMPNPKSVLIFKHLIMNLINNRTIYNYSSLYAMVLGNDRIVAAINNTNKIAIDLQLIVSKFQRNLIVEKFSIIDDNPFVVYQIFDSIIFGMTKLFYQFEDFERFEQNILLDVVYKEIYILYNKFNDKKIILFSSNLYKNKDENYFESRLRTKFNTERYMGRLLIINPYYFVNASIS